MSDPDRPFYRHLVCAARPSWSSPRMLGSWKSRLRGQGVFVSPRRSGRPSFEQDTEKPQALCFAGQPPDWCMTANRTPKPRSSKQSASALCRPQPHRWPGFSRSMCPAHPQRATHAPHESLVSFANTRIHWSHYVRLGGIVFNLNPEKSPAFHLARLPRPGLLRRVQPDRVHTPGLHHRHPRHQHRTSSHVTRASVTPSSTR